MSCCEENPSEGKGPLFFGLVSGMFADVCLDRLADDCRETLGEAPSKLVRLEFGILQDPHCFQSQGDR